jgi:hypothetical protein
MKIANKLAIVLGITTLTLISGCSSAPTTTETPEETAYLNASYEYFKSIDRGLDFSSDVSDSMLEFGYDICEDMAKYPDNTKQQNILGEQASVRLSQDEDESQNTDILVKEVELAALYLCPTTSGK